MHFMRMAFRKTNLGPALFAAALLAALAPQSQAAERLRFNRDIRPILSDKCFHCHGPDSKRREADLRLDERKAAVDAQAILPGNASESEIIVRILSKDPTEHMPPKKSKLGDLTPAEVDTLRRWIEQGAEYEAHWAFVPPSPVQATDPGSLIDRPVEQGLAERGLKLQPEADRNTLARRASFDLTGLPPEPAELAAFLADSAPDAYERFVDRLLNSPHYGEHMAVPWLDAARYADSYGFQVDRDRAVWPWRDWVVSAFNRNLPFNQFVTWQLAGDLLPNPSREQLIATAFNRLHQQEAEGGSIEEEYRVEYVADRVHTFATTFLGLTFECARCHDHKFDPISQKDYYKLFALFQNVDEAGLYSFFTSSAPTPAIPIPDEQGTAQLHAAHARVSTLEAGSAEILKAAEPEFVRWLETRPQQLAFTSEIGQFTLDSLDKGQLANALDPAKPAKLTGENKLVPGHSGNAVEFTGDDPLDLQIGDFSRKDPFSIGLWIRAATLSDRAVVLHRSRAWTDAGSRGYELLLENGRLRWSLVHFWPGDAASIRSTAPLPASEWHHVVVTSDGSGKAAGLRIFVDGSPAPVQIDKDCLTRDITGGGHEFISLGERFRDRGFKGGQVDELRVFSRELGPLEALALAKPEAATALLQKPAEALTPEEKSVLRQHFIATSHAPWTSHLQALHAARKERDKIASAQPEIMVMRELPKPKPAYVLFRGQYDQRRDPVEGGTPSALPPLPPGAPSNRLGLAQWVTAPENPLTARVTVNRFWQSVFGRGLVKTSEDFGSQSARPIYQDVLDGLASQFIQSGWDTKALMKLMVTSRTYRQRSIADARTMADDPDNDWLARGPRFRLSAEMIRDNALTASGLLDRNLGGAPVSPYELSEAFKPAKPSEGRGVYRRSVYSFWRRTGPPPAMLAFDAPRRAVCAAKRERTDSPLQALILLNGPQYVEAARVLGERLHAQHAGNVPAMIREGFLRCLSREPDTRETAILTQLHAEQLALFRQQPAKAEALRAIGNTKPDASIPAPEAAAAAMLGQALLNHDACVVKR